MIRVTDIQNNLLHLIGWEQNYDTTDFALKDSLTQSESGLYYQHAHPLLTLHNLLSIAPDFKNTEYPVYNEETEYKKGNIVDLGENNLYKALKDTVGQQPESSPEYWEPTNPFSEWLESKTKASIQKAISRFITEKTASGTHKPLCENKVLFEGTGRLVDTVKNRNNLVGFEIDLIRSMGVTTRINKIGLQFTEPGEYTLYLMHSSMEAPVRTIKLTKTKRNSLEWFLMEDLYMPYISEDTEAGGSWFLCYKQSELPAGSLAIKKDRDWSTQPCRACSRSEFISWQAWSRYLELHPFYINEEVVGTVGEPDSGEPAMWDIEDNIYTYDSNYGINMEVTVQCDLTDFIIEQKSLFTDILFKQMAVDMLREFAYNPNVRTNRNSINASRADILYEIDGDSASLKKSGLSYQLGLSFGALKLSTQGLDRICLPCKNNGIKFRTV